jgi:flagellar biosynthesis/type III secretory pathway M-ring protein FliF/YscJ
MEQLRRAGNLIRQRLGELSVSQRLLIASLVVMLGMGLFVVQQYASSPDMVPLLDASYPAEDQQAAAQFLDRQGVGYEQNDTGVVMVSASTRPRLLTQMSQTPGALPSDTTILFNNLIDKQSWTKSDRQNRQLETIALQNELGHMLSLWKGIRSANVIIDVPVKRALGQPATRPTAAVSVIGDGALSQQTVDAIAGFVAGARSGLTPDRVRIVDGATGRQRRARSEDQISATTTQELVAQIEQRQQQKIADMLVYIPGVIVTVQAQVDATRRTTQKLEALPDGKGSVAIVQSETTLEREDAQPSRSAEAGVRPNTEADIFSSGGGTARSIESNGETEFDTLIGTLQESVVDPRGFATKINAVVNVPRSYFEGMWSERQRREGAEGGGDEASAVEELMRELAGLGRVPDDAAVGGDRGVLPASRSRAGS